MKQGEKNLSSINSVKKGAYLEGSSFQRMKLIGCERAVAKHIWIRAAIARPHQQISEHNKAKMSANRKAGGKTSKN